MSCVFRSVGQESEYAEAQTAFAFLLHMRVNYRVQKQTGKWILDRSVVQSNSQSSSTVADTALTHQHHLQHIGKVTEKISDFLLGLMFTDYAHSKINSF